MLQKRVEADLDWSITLHTGYVLNISG